MKSTHPVLGGLMLMSAMACFSLSDAFAKAVAGLSPVELAWCRYAMLLLTVLPLALVRRQSWRAARPGLQLARALALVASAVLFLQGLQLLPMAEATAMVFASPMFVTLLAMLLLHEPMTARRWAPVLTGFAGVMIVMRPGGFGFGGAELFPVASSMAWAVSVICTRKLSAGDGPVTTVLYSSAIGTLVLSGLMGGVPSHLTAGVALPLVCMALAWCGGQWLVISAYRVAQPSAIAPFSYSQLIWAGLLGYLAFGHVPDGVSLVGMGVILASGLYAAAMTRGGWPGTRSEA